MNLEFGVVISTLGLVPIFGEEKPGCGEGMGIGKRKNVFDYIRSNPPLSLIIGGVVLFMGILFSDIPTMIVSPNWPTTDGMIISNRLMGHRFKEYDGDYYTKINAYIRYEYSVEGVSYSSLSINSMDSPNYPASVASRYPVGKDVVVYYNPKDPADAVLEPGYVGLFKPFDVFSYLIFGVGLYFIYLGILEIKKSRDKKQMKILMEKYKHE